MMVGSSRPHASGRLSPNRATICARDAGGPGAGTTGPAAGGDVAEGDDGGALVGVGVGDALAEGLALTLGVGEADGVGECDGAGRADEPGAAGPGAEQAPTRAAAAAPRTTRRLLVPSRDAPAVMTGPIRRRVPRPPPGYPVVGRASYAVGVIMARLAEPDVTNPVPTPLHPWLRRILVANLVAEVILVVTGGIVRLTGSGLGCPTWPKCTPESFIPVAGQDEGFHKYIEFGNRTLTPFLVTVAAIAVVVAVWRLAPDRPQLKRLSGLPLVGVAIQAVVGGVTVLARLNPITVSLHFLASMVLVALSAYLLFRAEEGDGRPHRLLPREVQWVAWAVASLSAVILVLGTIVTGTGPHSGDARVHRYPFEPRSVSWLHADTVMLFLGLVVAVWLAARVAHHTAAVPRSVAGSWLVLLWVSLGQGLIGAVQYLTALPEVLVAAHMLGASLLVIAVVHAMLALRTRAPLAE